MGELRTDYRSSISGVLEMAPSLAVRSQAGQSSLVGTAQETYDEMVREGLRPSLKALGFQGSGTTFTWPSRSHFSQLGLQKSQFSDRDALRFTVNVTIADRSSWEAARTVRPYLPKKPAPNTFYGDYIWQRRIGALMPSGEDTWWTISAGDDWRPVAEEVLGAVRTHALPELKNRDAP